MMRVAIFHDYFGAIGGGERTALTLARAFDATVYTTDISRPSIDRIGYRDIRLVSLGSLIQRVPLKQMHAFAKFMAAAGAADADVYILSGNWAAAAARRHHPNVMYCYTPPRGFYDLREEILRRQKNAAARALFRSWSTLHGAADQLAWTNVDAVVAISENVRRRIRRYYRREARVIYPPTDVSRYRSEGIGDFWLSVNRLYPEKRLELQFEVFRRLPNERLVVVGGYSMGDHADRYVGRLRPPPNVELRGEVPEDELVRLYGQCRGLICTAMDEDFGLTPVEAMASGKIVLATDEGGFRETIAPGETGWLLPPEPEAFATKIRELGEDDLAAHADACRERARRFDVRPFLDQMRIVLEEAIAG